MGVLARLRTMGSDHSREPVVWMAAENHAERQVVS